MPGGDHERPLAPRGKRAAARIGEHLAAMSRIPDLVLCSTSRRTVETWRHVAAAFPAEPPVERDRALYLAPPARILARIERVDDAVAALLVIGHNPGFQELACQLARTAAERDRIGKFPTAALARFALARGGWRDAHPGVLRFVDLVRPADLGV